MSTTKRKRRTSVERQERVVELLWELLREHQPIPDYNGSRQVVKNTAGDLFVDLSAVGRASDAILATFGYDKVDFND